MKPPARHEPLHCADQPVLDQVGRLLIHFLLDGSEDQGAVRLA
jgi:hypothetical protein